MKKIKLLCVLFTTLFSISLGTFAIDTSTDKYRAPQESSVSISSLEEGDSITNPTGGGETTDPTTPPKTSAEEIAGYFTDLGMLLTLTVLLITAIKKAGKVGGYALQYLSWALGVILALCGYGLELGMFKEITIVQTLIAGFFTSLASNGIGSSQIWQGIYDLIGARLNRR